jgi:hypothetical protein
MSGVPSPQVIKRGDEYVIHNIDLAPLTQLQRLVVATLAWDQFRTLMEVNGVYKARDTSKMGSAGIGLEADIDRVAAQATDISFSALNKSRSRLKNRPDILQAIWDGQFATGHDVQRALGFKLKRKLTEGAVPQNKLKSSYYGKGDKFEEAVEPFVRYLAAWRKKDFLFTHVPPREARKRLAVIDGVMKDLAQAREDLGKRSHVATYRAD